MPLQIVRNDITRMDCDAIVNTTNPNMWGSSGVDGAIHAAAGPQLDRDCEMLGRLAPGEARLTKGYDLPCKYIIHTVGPVWQGGDAGERKQLTACYRNSLSLAKVHRCHSLAFPLISSGTYGYPKEEALQVATDTIRDFLRESRSEMQVYLVVFGNEEVRISRALEENVREYIDQHYVDTHLIRGRRERERELRRMEEMPWEEPEGIGNLPSCSMQLQAPAASMAPMPAKRPAPQPKASSLEDALKCLDESFTQMLLRKIDESGMTDAQCYKRANVDRKLFSKIRKDEHYRPKKTTAIAFAFALHLSRQETDSLLRKAGYALSESSRFDVIIEYCIDNGIYDIYEVNNLLFSFDEMTLGV